jgi:hypothetical protein
MSRRNGSHPDAVAAQSRREFLRRAGTMAGGLMVSDLAGLFRGKASAALSVQYQSGLYLLELDGVAAGWIKSFEGGAVRGEVVVEPPGASPFAKKHLGMFRTEPITITFGAGMGKPLIDWVKASLSGRPSRKSGAVVMADHNSIPKKRLEFQNALISEVAFPVFDGSMKGKPICTVRFTPESVRVVAVVGGAALSSVGRAATGMTPMFRLKIQGFEQAGAWVDRIEALPIRRKTVVPAVGELRNPQQASGGIEFPNLVFTLPEQYAGPFHGWHEDFVVKGNNGDAQERSGVLELLSPTGNTVLFTLSFFNLGIVTAALVPGPLEGSMSHTRVELYCERIDFDAGPVGSAATQGGTAPPPPVKGIAPPPGGLPTRSAPLQGAPGILAPAPLQAPK